MTSMSFNSIQGQQQIQMQNQPLALREGQVFHGTIKQLFPDQMAEVQVGNNKFVAKLEAPLKAGDAHFFQVTKATGQVEIKVVTERAASPQQQMTQLMQSMNLPKTPEMQQVLGHFIKQQLPIIKERMLAAESFMKALPDGVTKTDALAALQRMSDLKMPFTQQVFNALVLGAKTDGMSQQVQQFMQQINASSLADSVKQPLLNQLQTITTPLQSEVGGNMLANAIQTLQSPTAGPNAKEQMLTLLKNAGIVDKTATTQSFQVPPNANAATQNAPVLAGQLLAQVAATKPSEVPQMLQQVTNFVQNDAFLKTEQKGQIQQMLSRFAQLPMTQQTIDVFAKQLQQQLTTAYSQNQTSQTFAVNEQGVTAKEQLLSILKPTANMQQLDQMLRAVVKEAQNAPQPIQAQLTQSEAQVQNAVDSKAMEKAVKTVLKGLGLNYEPQLLNKATDIQQLAQGLKPQLMNLLQDAQMPATLRDSAEMLLARMNGMTLVSGENGPQHQLVMQVPLEFFGKKMDATLQWNGRMKDDGKIDADYARVLFYLTMESLQETVIDMQVQNRIVTINVFNENTDLNVLAMPLKESLRAGLADKDYQLSGLYVKQFNEPKAEKSIKHNDSDVSGVDIWV